tara:strand:- start:55239 stop:56573 length:1335 start_codon:yes stop_codon:yes gene_type:complete
MRAFKENLIKKKYKLNYFKLDDKKSQNFFSSLETLIEDLKINEISSFEVENKYLEKKIIKFLKFKKIHWNIIESPMFINTKEEFSNYLKDSKKPLMANYYKQTRKKLNILMEKNGSPTGGKWSFDEENRRKLPKDIDIPKMSFPKSDQITEEVSKVVNKFFSNNPGDTNNLWLFKTHNEVEKVLDSFIKKKINLFGDYEDSVSHKDNFLFHSAMSPYLNIGLITPEIIIKKVINHDIKNKIKINSLEGFVRQLIGWREFMRGIYNSFDKELENSNFFSHQRDMKQSWYDGNTGLPPLDFAIKNVIKYGWSHHIERLMILCNIMNLCEIKPKRVYQWFMEMFVDAYEWVMSPNVFGMGLYSDGGIFATKPYICGSNYFLKMMDFKKGDWCETMDGLYWRFIDKNKSFFKSNPRLSIMIRTLDKINSDRKIRIFKKAEEFIEKNTI